MAFQLKNFTSIVAAMINHLRATTTKITDFNPGSVARSLVEAPAMEIDELYQQMFVGLRESIEVSVFKTFNFAKLAATYASGQITFSASPVSPVPIIIPVGTVVRVPGSKNSYKTKFLGLLPANTQSVSVTAMSVDIGLSGNIPANSISELVGNIPGITSVTNGISIVNGRDDELDEERKIRFQSYISTLARGINAAICYGAKTATISDANGVISEQVSYSSIIEPYLSDTTKPPAVITCIIHNGVGGTSPALISKAQSIIDGYRLGDGTIIPGWKAAGVICPVVAAVESQISIAGAIVVSKDYIGVAVRDAALSAASGYVQSLPIGTEVVLSEIIRAIKSVDGVYKVNLTSPISDVAIPVTNKAMPAAGSNLSWSYIS